MLTSKNTVRGLTLSHVNFALLLISFVTALFVVQNPLLNILLTVPLVVLLGLSAKRLSGLAAFGALAMALSLSAAMLNIQRMADQSVALYASCVSQAKEDAVLTANAADFSACSERYLAPTLWRLEA